MNEVRGRLTERLTRSRVQLQARRAAAPLAFVVALGVFGALGAAFLFTRIDGSVLRPTETVRFEVGDATGVVGGFSDVRVRGVPAGQVTDVERRGTRVILVAKVQKRYGPIYRDARAELRPVTPLQDMYLDIVDAGSKEAGELGGDRALAKGSTHVSVRVADVLDAFKGRERTRMRTLLTDLGAGLDDNGVALRRAFVELTRFLVKADRVTSELAERRRHTRRLVHNMAVLTEDLGRREKSVRRLVGAGSATLGTLQRGSADLDATLRELPGTVTAIRASMTGLEPVLADLDPALRELVPVAEELDSALPAVHRLAGDLGRAASELDGPVRRLRPLASSLRPVSERLRGTVEGLLPELGTVHKVTEGLVKCETGFKGFFQWNVSMSKFGDLNGTVPRGSMGFALPNTGVPGSSNRVAAPSCVGGRAIGPRPVQEGDHK